MKKKKNIMKLLLTGLIALSSINTTYANSIFIKQEAADLKIPKINIYNSDEVRYLFNHMSEDLIERFNQNNKQNPIAFEMIDASDPTVLKFYNKVTHRENTEHLAISYFKQFKIDGKISQACFVFYEPTKNIFSAYMNKGFTQEEAFSYTTTHEIGHCLFRSRDIRTDRKGSELLADLFAIAHSMNNNKYNQAVKIIKINKDTSSEIHQNSQALEKFFLYSNENNLFANKKNPDELLSLVLTYFKENHSNHFVDITTMSKKELSTIF